ncbi:MAG: sulfotransferase family protein [Acidimicrobiales bacterium]
MTAPRLPRWTPVRVSWADGEGSVDWCRTDGERFDDPFFAQTAERCLRHPARLLFRRSTRLDDLAADATSTADEPSGFIFHLSRCGSTLVSQMLAALPSTFVISEAGPLDSVLRPPADVRAPAPDRRRAWLRAMVAALGRSRTGTHTQYVVKLDAWAAFQLGLVRAAFPSVPWLFLYRDPLEVLVSQLAQRGYHTMPGALSADGLDIPPGEAMTMAPEDYCARALAGICHAVLGGLDDQALLVDYRQLPDAVHDRIAAHFGIRVTADDRRAMAEVATRDAKNPVLAFEPDGATKRHRATPQAVAAAEQWLRPPYEALEVARGSRP